MKFLIATTVLGLAYSQNLNEESDDLLIIDYPEIPLPE